MLDPAKVEALQKIKYFRAPDDGRVVAIFIAGDFDEYEHFPPYFDNEDEIRHLKEAYSGVDPEVERRTKAHICDDMWPLQVVMLERSPGGITKPHYHVPEIPLPDFPTRHQILWCKRGKARIKVLTRQGHDLGDVFLEPLDLILMAEGHEVEFIEPKTQLVEIKQGPFPTTDEADKVDIEKVIPI
ncbi:MAG: hypothetical protein O7C63_07450 [Alphaproteobacteria bacterium]|nr:hypothetical protein [Alphaproteobacteria bacterium]MCZ6764751.1 hypothetical protein [Alphaproteobacteria bacterium]